MDLIVSHPVAPDIERALCAILKSPHDRPGADHILAVSGHAIRCFVGQLPAPSNELKLLADEFEGADITLTTHCGLRTGHAAWDLILQIHERTSIDALVNLGAVLVDCLASGKPLTPRLIRLLEQQLKPGGNRRSRRLAAITSRIAQSHGIGGDAGRQEQPQTAQLARFYGGLLYFAGEHRHQSRHDRYTLSLHAYCDAARQLRASIETGDTTAICLGVCVVTGLSAALVQDLPLRNSAQERWAAICDLASGTYLLDLDVIAPHARGAPADNIDCLRATRILERPLPAFLAIALRARTQLLPDAQTIGPLLDHPKIGPRTVIPHYTVSGHFVPSLARLQYSTELVAVQAGIHRVIAAHLSGRYQAVPKSKLYYTGISREALWAGAQTLYESVGWGAPVSIVPGLAAGAQAVATDASVTRWHCWMRDRVLQITPGRRYTLATLIDHNREYARLVASTFAFCAGARECQEFNLLASNICSSDWLAITDKRSKSVWNANAEQALPYPVPVPLLLTEQLALWQRHCAALARRLRRLAVGADNLITHLDAIAAGDPVPALIDIDTELQPQLLGTDNLTHWWPDWFARSGNWARAYWQTRLLQEGVASSDIDLFMRHAQSGTRPMTSVSGKSVASQHQAVRRAQARVLQRLGIEPVPGIVK